MASAKVIWRIIKFFFRKIPLESVFSGLSYLMENFHPTIITVLCAYFFEAAYGYLEGSAAAAALWRCAGWMIGYYILYKCVYSLSSICINAGICEKALHFLNDDLIRAGAGLPMVLYEDEEALSCRKRAEECVKGERIPGIFMLVIALATSTAGILSLLATLGTYHPALPLVAALSVASYYVSDWLIEREGYQLEKVLTRKKRMRDYIWSLFTSPGNVREMRVMGFSSYPGERWKQERDGINEQQWRLKRKKCRFQLLCDAIKTFGYLAGVALSMALLARGRTTIIISHRVGLCRYVDKIAVMAGGTLREWGSHEELMEKGGEYARLYRVQSKWYSGAAPFPEYRKTRTEEEG